MLRYLFPRDLNTILASFNKTIDELDSHRALKLTEAARHDQEILYHTQTSKAAYAEAQRAAIVADRITALVAVDLE